MQTELKTYLVQSKWTVTRAATLIIAMQRLQRSQVTKVPWPVHNGSMKGLTAQANASNCRDLQSAAVLNKKYLFVFPASVWRDRQSTNPICNQCTHHHLPKHGWHCHTCKFCNGLKHHSLSGCIIHSFALLSEMIPPMNSDESRRSGGAYASLGTRQERTECLRMLA